MIVKRIELDDSAYIDAYIADVIDTYERKAILVIPGGGYAGLSSEREGEPIAHSFVAKGFNAFVLHYSVNRKKKFPAQLIEASLAIKHIRDNCEEYGINKEEVYAAGFSAGGHLCGSLGILWDYKEIYEKIDMPIGYNKPKGIILMYPVVTSDEKYGHMASFNNLFCSDNLTQRDMQPASLELHVTKESSPAFIFHAADDTCVPVENSLILAGAYSKNNVPFELHIYPEGGHGFALGNDITMVYSPDLGRRGLSSWVDSAVSWMESL